MFSEPAFAVPPPAEHEVSATALDTAADNATVNAGAAFHHRDYIRTHRDQQRAGAVHTAHPAAP